MAKEQVAPTPAQSPRLPCDCKHAYQDRVYGHGIRLHTTGNKGYNCTVCGKTKPR